MFSRQPLPRRALGATALALSALFVLAGCAQSVALTAADDANNPACAAVTVRLPDTVADEPKRGTDAQATGAWGSPASVILHCGVAVPGPTTDACTSVNGIDWIQDDSQADENIYRFTTYGRDPAVEVVIDADPKTGVSGSTALVDLSAAVETIPATGQCVGASDLEAPAEN